MIAPKPLELDILYGDTRVSPNLATDHVKYVTILHLGDIHFSDPRQHAPLIDRKDGAVSDTLVGLAADDPLRLVMRNLLGTIEAEPIDAIAISGDLTDRGSLEGYRECVDYLIENLGLATGGRWASDQIHVVPGNHDVDRANLDHEGSPFEKFAPLREAWEAVGLPILPAESHRRTTIERDGRVVDLYSLNSCVGCGEQRQLPTRIRDQFSALLATYVEQAGDDAFSLIGEQLDTPLFHSTDVDAVTRSVRGLDPTVFPVLLAHHNLLPQALPRVEIYTELLNSGFTRSSLLTLCRPVLYLHGHIHEDPVEVVSGTEESAAQIVSISAPLLSRGYNVVRIAYLRSGFPIGCEVVPFSLTTFGAFARRATRRVRFRTSVALSRVDELTRTVLSVLPEHPVRFPDLLQSVRDATGTNSPTRRVADAALEGEWIGVLTIANRDDAPEDWHVERHI